MNEKIYNKKNYLNINIIIERIFFIITAFILIANILIGFYFNKYDIEAKQKNNIQKTHNLLSQMIIPSLIISDYSEVKRLLYMTSGNEETYVVVDNDKNIIISDYSKSSLIEYVKKIILTNNKCPTDRIIHQIFLINISYFVVC